MILKSEAEELKALFKGVLEDFALLPRAGATSI